MISKYGIFCKVIECGSFTKVAEEISYSQSAISQSVKSLEQELGTTLVTREKGGIRLTRDGQGYFPYLQEIYNAEQSLERKYSEMQGLENSLIRIGTYTSISRYYLPLVMKAFKEKYPTVKFELHQGDYQDIIQQVKNRQVDFGFTTPSAASGLPIKTFYKQELVAILPADHPLADKKTVTLADLAAEPFIIDDEGKFSLPLHFFSEAGLTPNIEFHLYDNNSIIIMVEQGLGVSIIDRVFLANTSANIVIREIEEKPTRLLSACWHNWDTMPIAARKFLKFFLSQPEFQDTPK